MVDAGQLSPAERAANKALAEVYRCLDSRASFVFEAGAGAGKTHSLIKALEYVIATKGKELVKKGQRVACITYTNVASEEIAARTGKHMAVNSSTIHSFCWTLIKEYQDLLRSYLPDIGKWSDRLEDVNVLQGKPIEYDLGYPAVRPDRILLGHSDIVPLAVRLLAIEKFRILFVARFPYLFIDEYQDTNREFATALKQHFLDAESSLEIGFFGDHWQKIYADGCGKIEHEKLVSIGKGANFRSVPAVVNLLNAMRPELVQAVVDPNAEGSVTFYHANEWSGQRRTDGHWRGDLPAATIHAYVDALKVRLTAEGWDFAKGNARILMLTHRALAAEQGYDGIAEAFVRNEPWVNNEDPIIEFLAAKLGPALDAYATRRFGAMFEALGSKIPTIRRQEDKAPWVKSLEALQEMRKGRTIGDVLKHLASTGRPSLPESVEAEWKELADMASNGNTGANSIGCTAKLLDVPYREVDALARFQSENSVFVTQHGVKGAEFDDVMVVCGRGWNHYDYNAMLEGYQAGVPADKQAAFERARNLFYVACSRPRRRLAVLFTQTLSAAAQDTLANWVGGASIQSLELP